jgi:hypothetical protein
MVERNTLSGPLGRSTGGRNGDLQILTAEKTREIAASYLDISGYLP